MRWNWRCFFGLHEWDEDFGEFYTVQRCKNCSRVNVIQTKYK